MTIKQTQIAAPTVPPVVQYVGKLLAKALKAEPTAAYSPVHSSRVPDSLWFKYTSYKQRDQFDKLAVKALSKLPGYRLRDDTSYGDGAYEGLTSGGEFYEFEFNGSRYTLRPGKAYFDPVTRKKLDPTKEQYRVYRIGKRKAK